MASNKERNVVLNFKMDGQVQYAKTLREINAVMNAAAKEYKNHIAAMKDDATATDKLTAEKKKLEVQMEAAKKRTEMLRAQYEAMSKDTKTTTGQLSQMYGKLLDAERAEMALQKSMDRVNAELSEQGQAVRDAKEELGKLGDEMSVLEAEQKRLSSSFDLQEASLKENATETEKLELAQKRLQKQMELTERVVDNLEKQLDQAKKAYGENSKEVIQLETKLNGAKVEIAKFNKELETIDDASKDAEKGLNNLSDKLESLTGVLIAGGGIAGIVSQALNTSSLNTKVDIKFNIPEESKKVIKEATRSLEAYGIDGEEALEGLRRQWALNADATDEANQKIVKGAGAIAAAYEGIDFIELIQETNEMSRELKISNEEALGLTNSLLKIGFPPEQLDIIAEYGGQLQRAGYDAKEVQAIMAAGVETGTWNIDNLLDGLKEGRIRVSEFGQEVPKALAELVEGTNISTEQLKVWGNAVAKGGEDGSKAMTEIAMALNGVDDETKKNLIGVQIFGTMYEDQGQNIIDTLVNANSKVVDMKENQNSLNETVKQLDSDPAVKMQQAMADVKTASEPLLSILADVISAVAGWVSKNPELTATIVAIVSALGIFIGLASAIAPIITAIGVTSGGAAIGVGALTTSLLPIIGIIAAVIAAITAVILIIKNWGSIVDWFKKMWDKFGPGILILLGPIGMIVAAIMGAIEIFKNWGSISDWLPEKWKWLKSKTTEIFNFLGDFFKNWGPKILTILTGPIGIVVSTIIKNWDSIKSKTKESFNKLVDLIKTPINKAKDAVAIAIDKIKGLFNFQFKWPKLKMPKFSISGSMNPLDWLKEGPPKLSVHWNAKGGIFTRPTIFGAYGGQLQGAGEAGPEAALPLNEETLGTIGRAIAETMGVNGEVIVPVTLEIDGEVLARKTVRYNSIEMRNLKDRSKRGGGRGW